jgi:hypothetical protein
LRYHEAARLGERRVKEAQAVLAHESGYASLAFILKDSKDGRWEPVGQENMVAIAYFADDTAKVVICDVEGYVKTFTNGMSKPKAEAILQRLKATDLEEYTGKIRFPV